jgi:hypothetical protein
MRTNSGEKKQKEQEPYGTQTYPHIYPNCNYEQNAVFDDAKPARLRMQGDISFLPIKIFEGHVLSIGRAGCWNLTSNIKIFPIHLAVAKVLN